ncbi:PIR Superfamily Protein [Plasmodium ovale curtisi]|uniref:PIR Superfamily Protein n=1 Tax=Plasmodium ovale curtisi TaxID=864141 RepID=A0A1A8XDV1_PLAOA|nr:PIR Superfamily Protein [Plasmodium ovale curtisi]
MGDDTFVSLKNKHTFIKNNDLKVIYEELENVCTEGNYYYYCTGPPDENTKNNKVKKLQYKFQGNKNRLLLNNGEFKLFNVNLNKWCTYFKYWIYDQVITNVLDDNDITEVFKLLEHDDKVIEFYKGELYNTCKFNIFKLEEVKKMKLLYDYFENYDSEKNKSSINELICNSEYKKDLSEIIDFYINRSTYCEKQSNVYCKELDECVKAYGVDNLSVLQCNGDNINLPQAQASQSLDSNNGEYTVSSSPGDTGENLKSNYGHMSGEHISIKTTAAYSLSVIGIFGVFLFLYKLTPFGSWLKKYILNISNKPNNIEHKAKHNLLENELEADNISFIERSHYISYNPS